MVVTQSSFSDEQSHHMKQDKYFLPPKSMDGSCGNGTLVANSHGSPKGTERADKFPAVSSRIICAASDRP